MNSYLRIGGANAELDNPTPDATVILIAPALRRLGVEMRLIRADGRVQSEDESEREAGGGQVSLEFDS